MALQTRNLSIGKAVQILNKISVEYDFSEPSYVVKSLRKHQELLPFQATCEIKKRNNIFLYWVTSPTKEVSETKRSN